MKFIVTFVDNKLSTTIRLNKRNAAYAALSVIVILAVTLVITLLRRTINRSLYAERQQTLSLVAGTAADIADRNTAMTWNMAEYVTSSLMHGLKFSDDIESCIRLVNGHHDLRLDHYYLVDSKGKYYCSDLTEGKLTDPSRFLSTTPDRDVYLGTLPHLDKNRVYITYRQRIEPITINSRDGKATILYIAYAQDPQSLVTDISELFPGEVNTFIHDETGQMIFKHLGLSILMEGYNVYDKFDRSEKVNGEKSEDLVAASINREKVVVELGIAGERYFFCSAPMDSIDWTLAFIVKKEMVSGMGEIPFPIIVFLISLIAVILGITFLGLVYSIMHNRRNKERLAESERLADAMGSASRAKSEFLSNMSHDIRTPINGIMGMTSIALDCADDPDKVRSCLGKISGASHHLLSLINDVLDMSRIESGKTRINNTPADVRVICDNCVSIIKGQLIDRTLDFRTEYDVTEPRILADDLHLRQVLINILGNAVKFTPDGGVILFSCTQKDCTESQVTFEFVIKDSGIGMSKEFQERIFDSFSQEENRGRSNYKGTGLGMAITKQLVDLMGGEIKVESELDKGSTFRVGITFERDFCEAAEAEESAGEANIEGCRILLVEDNELNREIASTLLEDAGAHIFCAEDGIDALEKFSGSEPGTYDVILMDIMMPRMNGLDATRAIRALQRPDAATIPILAMTANAFDEDIRATQEAGMNAHLSKPINLGEVLEAISFHFKRQPR